MSSHDRGNNAAPLRTGGMSLKNCTPRSTSTNVRILKKLPSTSRKVTTHAQCISIMQSMPHPAAAPADVIVLLSLVLRAVSVYLCWYRNLLIRISLHTAYWDGPSNNTNIQNTPCCCGFEPFPRGLFFCCQCLDFHCATTSNNTRLVTRSVLVSVLEHLSALGNCGCRTCALRDRQTLAAGPGQARLIATVTAAGRVRCAGPCSHGLRPHPA